MAVLLVTIGCLLAPLSVVAVWANSQITDQSRYLDTVAPISESPEVQAAVTDNITNRVLGYVDVAALTTEAVSRLSANGTLPPALAGSLNALAKPLADGVKGFVHDQVANVVSSQAFSDAWLQANRVAHQEVIGALTGEGAKGVQVSNGEVSVNIGPIVAEVKTRLVDQGFTLAERIPAGSGC
jgi:poly(3-hydroxybutyrate) depolymerase